MIAMQFAQRALRLVGLASFALAALGCGSPAPGPKVFPVNGKVLVDGKPAHRAQVLFHSLQPPVTSEGMTVLPFAVVEADGTFRPSTFLTADGAPAGEYKVTIVWPEVQVVQGEEVEGPDQLQGKYNNSGQPLLAVTVTEGRNELPPFEIQR